MTSPELRFICGLLAEDVRREDNGKLLIIGIYEQNIQFTQFPMTLELRPVVIADVMSPGDTPIKVVFSFDGKFLFEGETNVSALVTGRVMLPLPKTLIHFEGPGKLIITCQAGEGETMTLWSGPVHLREL